VLANLLGEVGGERHLGIGDQLHLLLLRLLEEGEHALDDLLAARAFVVGAHLGGGHGDVAGHVGLLFCLPLTLPSPPPPRRRNRSVSLPEGEGRGEGGIYVTPSLATSSRTRHLISRSRATNSALERSRGCGMVTSTISLMVPGRVAMTTMRSARKIDSEML